MRIDQVAGTGSTGTASPRAGERRAYPRKAVRLLEWETTVLVDGEQSGGRLALIECEGVRGDAAPLHVHDNEDEVLYALEGELTVLLVLQPHFIRRRPVFARNDSSELGPVFVSASATSAAERHAPQRAASGS